MTHMHTRALVFLVAAAACLLALAPRASAEDGATLSQRYEPATGRVHIDINVTFSGGGGSQYTAYVGAGTVRVTFPQPSGVTLPAFDSTRPTEPDPVGCKVDTGADGQANSGFVCSFNGQRQEAELLFPTNVVMHFVSTACYPFPDLSSRQPARVDVWTAQDVTDGHPDATYAIGSTDPCSVPPPPAVAQVVAGTKTCTVPNLKGLALTKAGAKLKKAGCVRGKVTQAFSGKVKKGRVISQSVKANKKVKRGTKIKLVVSKGAKKT